jgi:hypothetical protein
MTPLVRFKPLVRAILGNHLTGMIAAGLFVIPSPIAFYFGSAVLEANGLIPESIAVFFVCFMPLWTGVVFLTAFWLIDTWAQRK